MFRKSLMALAIASLTAGSALGGGIGRRGQAARHDADARSAPRRPATRTARFPSTPAGIKPPAGLQGRQRHPRRSVRQREAAPGDHRQGHGGARRQADRGHEGAAQALPDDARRRLPDAPHGRAAAARARQHAEERHRREDRRRRPRASRTCCPAIPFPIPKTGYEAMWNHLLRYSGARLRRLKYDNWNVDSAGVPTLAVDRRGVLGVADLRSEEDGRDQGQRSVLATSSCIYVGPARRDGEALLVIDSVNPLKQGAPRLAVPAGPAPREARAGPRLRHAESGRRRRGDLRRRVGVQRRDGPLRLEARRQEGDVRPVQQLPADLPQDRGRHHQAEPPQSRPRALGAASRLGRRGDAEGRTSATSTASACSTSTRTAGSALASDEYDAPRPALPVELRATCRTATTCRRRSATPS